MFLDLMISDFTRGYWKLYSFVQFDKRMQFKVNKSDNYNFQGEICFFVSLQYLGLCGLLAGNPFF